MFSSIPARPHAEATESEIVDIYPLTPMQEGFLYQSLLLNSDDAYLEQFHVELPADTDQIALGTAWREIMSRHEILRTSFTHLGLDRPLQLVHEGLRPPLEICDHMELAAFLAADRKRPFDLESPPLWRLTLIRGSRLWLVWSFHHIILDGWSLNLILSELAQLLNQTPGVGELPQPRPFRDFINWLEQRDPSGDRQYWRNRLTGFHRALPLPGAILTHNPNSQDRHYFSETIDPPTLANLQALCRDMGITNAVLVTAAWALLLARYADTDDVVFGMTVAGRPAALHGVSQMTGPFLNTLPARVRIGTELRPWLQQLGDDLAADEAHAWLSPANIAADSDIPAGEQLFHSLFVFENLPVQNQPVGLQAVNPTLEEQIHYPLGLQALPLESGLQLRIHADLAVIPTAVASHLPARLIRILTQMGQGLEPNQISLTNAEERRRILSQLHAHLTPPVPAQSPHEVFEELAETQPNAPALVTPNGVALTYAELNASANHLAQRLLSLDLQPEEVVGVWVDGADAAIIACLAIFKAGCVYLPFETELPPARLQFMADDAHMRVLITQSQIHPPMAFTGPVLALAPDFHSQSAPNPNRRVDPGQAAYVIYTSGSTGKPKGAICCGGALVHMLRGNNRVFQIGATDRCSVFHSLNFDASMLEIWGGLLFGACMAPVPKPLKTDHPQLARWLMDQRITVAHQPPANLVELVAVMPDPAVSSLSLVLFGGAPLNPAAVRSWLESPNLRLINCYGLTETTVSNTCHVVEPLSEGLCPIGHSRVDTLYLLDKHMRPVPMGVPGRLYLGGITVSRGYLNRPGPTAARFVPAPAEIAGDLWGGRLYQTGDRAVMRADGALIFLGRDDDQIKVRGLRIELAEISTALDAFPGLRDHHVQLFKPSHKPAVLAAWVVAHQPQPDWIDNLRRHLAQHLPQSMVPAVFTVLDHLPLNTSGKVDRAALPDPVFATQPAKRPLDPNLMLMTQIWADVLNVDRPGPNDNFFHLGGHSLLVTRLIARVSEAFEKPLRPTDLFSHPTPRGLVDRLTRSAVSPISDPQPRKTIHAPLSHAQQRLWTLHQLEPDSVAYHIPQALRLLGQLDQDALIAAWRRVLERHESLRTSFQTGSPQPLAVLNPPHPMVVETPAGDSAQARRQAASRLIELETRVPFDLASGPLYRVRLFHIGPDEHLLFLNLHHAITDAWSMQLLADELEAGYNLPQSEPDPLSLQYGDYAQWRRNHQHAGLFAQQLQWWRRELADLQPLDLPDEKHSGLVGFQLDATLSHGLLELAKDLELTAHMLLESVFVVLVARVGENRDIAVGVPASNRDHARLDPLIGLFVNTLVLRHRLSISGDPELDAFSRLALQTRTLAANAYARRDLPFDLLVEALRPERERDGNPLFRVMFSLTEEPPRLPRFNGLTCEIEPIAGVEAKFDLGLSLTLVDGQFLGELESGSLHEDTIHSLIHAFKHLCGSILSDPDQPWPLIPMVPLQIQHHFKAPFQPVHAAFFAAARQFPHHTALEVYDGDKPERLDYQSLADQAQSIGAALQQRGVGMETVVAVVAYPKPATYAAVLGVLAAGAIYLPLSPDSPLDRCRYMLESTGAALVLGEPGDWGALPVLDPAELIRTVRADLLRPIDLGPVNGACLIHTSGSGGKPKGILVHHGPLSNHCQAVCEEFELNPRDRVLQFASLSFDVASEEIFPTLAAGAALIKSAQTPAPEDFGSSVKAWRLSVVNLPASYWAQWTAQLDSAAALPPYLRLVIAGSETVRPGSLMRWREQFPSYPKWRNGYGPSEACISAMFFNPDSGGWESSVPIGQPISGVVAHVLDDRMQPLPHGVVGELYLGGACLSRGYAGLPAQTAAQFVPDPFSHEPGARLYRSGDRVRQRSNGRFLFLGRRDDQLKLRGYRIEPGEVEAVLAAHPHVLEAVVQPLEEQQTLAAWLTVDSTAGTEHSNLHDELYAFCTKALPAPMVPSRFVVLAGMPKTAGGKIDRSALSLPQVHEAVPTPDSQSQDMVTAVWAAVLNRDDLNDSNHFFRMGGHSLGAIRVINRINQAMGTHMTPRDLFEHPVLADFRRLVQRNRGSSVRFDITAEPQINPNHHYPLSYGQERLWVLQQLTSTGAAYHMPELCRIRGSLDVDAFENAVQQLIQRHDMLRAAFCDTPTGPIQIIQPEVDTPLRIVDLRGESVDTSAWVQAEISRPFDLSQAPAFRMLLLRLDRKEHLLIHTTHHLISDAWSHNLILSQLTTLYQNPKPAIPPARFRYTDFVRWQRKQSFDNDLAWWRQTLTDAPQQTPLPFDNAAGADSDFSGGAVDFVFEPTASRGLLELSRRCNTTLFMTLEAVFSTLLYRYGGDDLVVGTAVTNRDHHLLSEVVGFFVNTIGLRHHMGDNPPFDSHLQQVREVVLAAGDRSHVPFEAVVDAVTPERQGVSPLFNVMFTLNHEGKNRDLGDLVLQPERGRTGTAKWDLYLAMNHCDGRISGCFEYRRDRFQPATIQRMVSHLKQLAGGVIAHPQTRLGDLPLLSQAEQEQILRQWHTGETVHSHTPHAHQRFFHWAQTTPYATALTQIDEGGAAHLTYGETAVQVSALCTELARRGIGPGSRVALCLAHSSNLIVAALAVMNRGAAYVPLDPSQPQSRLRHILDDAQPQLMLTEKDLAGLDLQIARDEAKVGPAVPAAATAYIIYTSGSTGKPKGVPVCHGAVTRLFKATAAWYHFTPQDVWTLFHSFAFDFSVWEMWGALRFGGRLVITPRELSREPSAFLDLLIRERVTILNQTPSAFYQLMNEAVSRHPLPELSLRRVIFGGEALDPRKLKPWFDAFDNPPQLINMYGITETTVFVTRKPLTAADAGGAGTRGSIGTAMNDQAVFVLDAHLQPVPIGVVGEIHIGGAGLSRGYLNQPGQTAQRFIPRPAELYAGQAVAGDRLYRTGDLAAYLPNGELSFKGRLDHQIQLRGFRVEPGEIEACLLELPQIRQALVILRQPNTEQAALTGYVTVTDTAQPLDLDHCRSHLRSQLPAYMVPNALVVLPALPLTANGKINTKALPAPDVIGADSPYRAPQTETEKRLTAIWQEVLNLDEIGLDANFFGLGGNSLTAAGCMSRIRAAVGVRVPLQLLFENPTIAGLSQWVDAISDTLAAMDAIEGSDDDEEFEL